MTSTLRALKRKPAKGVARRTATFGMPAPYDGWEATVYADFKAGTVADLTSGELDRVLRALDKVVISHNFPDADDDTIIAASFSDIDMDALNVVVDAMLDAIAKLPKR